MSRKQPILLLRGLCKDSALRQTHTSEPPLYTPKQLSQSPNDVFFAGLVATEIRFDDSALKWVITEGKTVRNSHRQTARAESEATKLSYALGIHEWKVTGDLYQCHGGQPYTTFLKLTGCSDGHFTCSDGQCVTMEERCNQIPNCRDESDEENCKVLVLKSTYNKKVPPIVPKGGGQFEKTIVEISISLLKVVSMEEVQHKIDLQFEITLEWKENRAVYHNLKLETSLNALTDGDVYSLWLPYVIYANTDMKEAVQLEDGLQTTIVVNREGDFVRNGNDEIDEIEIYQGNKNMLNVSNLHKEFPVPLQLAEIPV